MKKPACDQDFGGRFNGQPPAWRIASPGRINLIGEHTDYNGFPVMPMAIDRCVRLAAAPSEGRAIELEDLNAARYGRREFSLARDIPPAEPGDWSNYARAAIQSLVRLCEEEGRDAGALRGMRCLIGSDLPSGAGLASSSALVVACALAFAACNGRDDLFAHPEGRRTLADRMAAAEHYVGTQGGGMDHAVCLLAREECALRIDFFPLRADAVAFPRGCSVVAAHSTVRVEKARERRLAYNRRVIECAIGKDLLASRMRATDARRLADLCAPGDVPAMRHLTGELMRIVQGRESLGVAEAAALLGETPEQFAPAHLRMKDGTLLSVPADGLKVLPRCRHVFTEAARVYEASRMLKRGDIAGLGRVMDESHRSCAEDYEISGPELDELTVLMRGAGALGARLTGAGFGGFAIGLVAEGATADVCEKLTAEFYRPRGLSAEGHVFVFRPAAGARVESLLPKSL